jgi:transposase InsO family protein
MSAERSPGAGRRYGLQRVCQVLGVARSSLYAARQRARSNVVALHPVRRGPKPKLADTELLAAIQADLAASPFIGEGHRKVWARLRLQQGIGVSRTRVLRLMREHRLLSPHRQPRGTPNEHEGHITTEAPDLMWGTDGVRIETAEDGWVWVFSAVDHCHAECVGWHAVKIGDRFAALEPIAQGLTEHFGGVGTQVARGLALRFDHGTQYMSDHFLNQLKFWGIAPSPAFVAEPQTNGVAERFNRTLKEQAIHGRVFRNLEQVRRAVGEFVDRYNAHWRVEKLGFLSPREARQAHALRIAA